MQSTEPKAKKSHRGLINTVYISLTVILLILYFVPSMGRNISESFSNMLSSITSGNSGSQSQDNLPFKYSYDNGSRYCQITGVGTYSEESLYIPQRILRYTVNGIASNAFYGQKHFKSLTVHGLVESIGADAFAECTGIEIATIRDGVLKIGDRAFSGCTSLRTLNIPLSVNAIGKEAFWGCTSLTDIYFSGSMEQWHIISQSSEWSSNINCTVHCINGDILASDFADVNADQG